MCKNCEYLLVNCCRKTGKVVLTGKGFPTTCDYYLEKKEGGDNV